MSVQPVSKYKVKLHGKNYKQMEVTLIVAVYQPHHKTENSQDPGIL